MLLEYFLAIQLIAALNSVSNVEAEDTRAGDDESKQDRNFVLSAEMYSKLFRERRREQNLYAKQMLKSPYERNSKVLNLVYGKIFQVLMESNATLIASNYSVKKYGFPQNNLKLQVAVTMLLENCCIAGENVLHFPEISYRVFRELQQKNWKSILNWCIEFVSAYPHIIDELTVKLLELLRQELNPELREENYVNPYYKKQNNPESVITKKPARKRLKRGPQLSGGSRDEL